MAWLATGVAGAAAEVPDRAFVRADADDVATLLAQHLAEREPAVVVTYGPDGGYGHPDHVRAHDVAMRAVARLVEAGGPAPVVLWAVAPERRGEVVAAGGPRVEVPLAPVLDEVAAAMRAHATQVQGVAVGHDAIDFALSNDVPLRAGPREVFEPATGAVRPFAWPAGVEAFGWPVP
jgi:N-acetyl-1-D-myo-inositol-2-amino-2-deoxy-alpha-D-glucopyranoside deacetylase